MRNRLTSALMPLLAATLLIGCDSPQPTDDSALTGVNPNQIQYVQILEQETGSNESLNETMVELIDSEQERSALGVDIPLAEQVNWNQQSLIVLAMGEQNTGGHWARITGVQRVGEELWVQGVVNQPAPDAMVTQQITYPYAAAIIPKPAGEVQFRRQIDTVTGRQPEAFVGEAGSEAEGMEEVEEVTEEVEESLEEVGEEVGEGVDEAVGEDTEVTE